MYTHILVPTDGSLLSTRTVASAVDFARSLGARLTFLYVEPDVTTDLYGEGALLKAMDQGQFANRYRLRGPDILAKAELAAQDGKVPCDSLTGVSNTPYEVIIEAAEQQGCDLIYMASRGRGGVAGMMIGSETLKTVMHATIPILIHSVGANAPIGVRVLAVIQDEHQAIAEVMNKLQSLSLLARRGGVRPDAGKVREMIAYFRDFSARTHQPKDDDLLFSLLSRRTDVVDGTIAELKRQHLVELRLIDDLQASVRVLTATSGDLTDFCDAADRFGAHLHTHLRLEEEVIFPAARAHLTHDDWQMIEGRFAGRGREGVVETGARLLKQAYSRIVSSLEA